MSDVADLYEVDFVRWSEEQASALRSAGSSGTNLPLDWEHLAEEIDSLGRSLRSELRSRCATIIEHLLTLEVSGSIDPRAAWIETVQRERVDVETLLDDNPSLRSTLAESADLAGRKLAPLSLERYGEWTAAARRHCETRRFTVLEVLGPWLPPTAGAPDA